jgi:phosphate transport system protein
VSAVLEGHTAKAFDGALLALHAHVIEMGGLVLDQVKEATRAYTDWDARGAERVLEREPAVDAYDARLKEEQINLIARRQPVASDLRAVIAMSKAVSELERAGDEAKKIARTVLKLEGRPGPATSRDARHLGQLAIDLLHLSLQAFDGLDRRLAAEVTTRDHDLDEEYRAGLRRLLTRAMEDPRAFEVALEAAFVLKSLERIGDHARNLARQLQSMSAAAAPAAAEELDSTATPPPATAR